MRGWPCADRPVLRVPPPHRRGDCANASGEGPAGRPSGDERVHFAFRSGELVKMLLDQPGFDAQIACKGIPIEAAARWAVERTSSWMNGCGKLLQAAPNVTLSSSTSTRYRWDTHAAALSG